MFRLIEKPEFTHDVPVMVPIDGGHRKQELRTRFRALDDDEIEGFDLTDVAGVKEFLRKAIVRFENVEDESAQPVPHSDELRDRMLATPFVRLALMRAYARAVTEARTGN